MANKGYMFALHVQKYGKKALSSRAINKPVKFPEKAVIYVSA